LMASSKLRYSGMVTGSRAERKAKKKLMSIGSPAIQAVFWPRIAENV